MNKETPTTSAAIARRHTAPGLVISRVGKGAQWWRWLNRCDARPPHHELAALDEETAREVVKWYGAQWDPLARAVRLLVIGALVSCGGVLGVWYEGLARLPGLLALNVAVSLLPQLDLYLARRKILNHLSGVALSITLKQLLAHRLASWRNLRPNGSEKVLAALLEGVRQAKLGIQPGQVLTNVALAKWQKSAQAMKDLFETCIPVNEHVERSSMLGSPCALVRGNLYCGLHDDNLYFRLDAES